MTSDRLSDEHIEYLLRRPETSFNAVEMALAREVQESRAEIERLRAALRESGGAIAAIAADRDAEHALADRLAEALIPYVNGGMGSLRAAEAVDAYKRTRNEGTAA